MDVLKSLMSSPMPLLGVAFITALGFVGTMGVEDAIQTESHYCEMVRLYKEANGQSGWPDYKNSYGTMCLDSDAR